MGCDEASGTAPKARSMQTARASWPGRFWFGSGARYVADAEQLSTITAHWRQYG